MDLKQLLEQLEAKKVEIRGFINDKKLVEAKKAVEEKRALETLVEEAKKEEEEEKRSLEDQKPKKKDEEVNEVRAFTKKVMGKTLTEEERAIIKTTDNAPVIPKQFLNRLQELQKGFGSLKEYCDIIPVTKNEGTFPLVDLDQNTIAEVSEGADIIDGTLVTTDLPFKCSKVGLKQVLTSELIDDAEVEIESLVNKNFANITVLNQNTKIVKVITDNATPVTPATKDYMDVQNVIDSSLPTVKNGLATLTNVTGYCYLKNLTDKNNRPLNLVTEVNGKYYFGGKELIVCDDALVKPSKAGSKIFYVLNMKEAVKYFDRKSVTVERWRKPDNDTNNVSILERFGVGKGSVRSVRSLEF